MGKKKKRTESMQENCQCSYGSFQSQLSNMYGPRVCEHNLDRDSLRESWGLAGITVFLIAIKRIATGCWVDVRAFAYPRLAYYLGLLGSFPLLQ